MIAEILCVGTELLLGDVVNTNAAYAARELAAIGINVYFQSVVGDNPARLKKALALALSRSDLVVMTGGLGPTYDDLTKETVAEAFGLPMELHQPSLDAIASFFKRTNRIMTKNNEKQAWMPKGAHVFTNNYGTAPGLAVEKDGKRVVLLPGPPREMEPMFSEEVIPYLKALSDTVLVSHVIHIFGMGESAVEDKLKEYMLAHTNPTVAPYAKEGEVQLRVTAGAKNEAEADAMIWPVIEEIREVLGDVIYGIDVGSLQAALVQQLLEKNRQIATAESCTAGLVSKRITEISGSSSVFECGIVSYSNSIKRDILGVSQETLDAYGAVSDATVREMARGVRKLSGADIGVAISGIAGPGGGTPEKPVGLVYVCASCDGFEEVLELHLSRRRRNERENIRYLASSNALALAIKALRTLEKK
jgi:nicotinamide-nucleotide amidase